MNLLNPVEIPLNQNALIEASAGTGKTYTITTLYLRAILGLIDGHEVLAPKSIDQILVVTFTEAATLEIKDRVRQKLKEAQLALLELSCNESGNSLGDPNLERLFLQFKRAYLKTELNENTVNWCLAAYQQIQDALVLIDEASIFTIHGFCHRCLTQFAFETNSSFEQEFEMDAGPIWQQAVYDFWRRFVSPLQGSEFEWFSSFWSDPKSLFEELAPLVGKPIVLAPVTDKQTYEELLSRFDALISKLKQQWREDDFSSVLVNSGLKKTTKMIKRLPQFEIFLNSDSVFIDLDKDMGWRLFGTENLNDAKNYKAKSEQIAHSITKIIDELADVEEQLKTGKFKSFWLNTSRQFIEQKAQALKTEQGVINPDDLLTELAQAVSAGTTSLPLLTAIRTRYPLAFIDEFQDTDPIQYTIFRAIYNEENNTDKSVENGEKLDTSEEEANDSSANMLLIGDPKQAIYKFRGADIFTYIRAKEDMPEDQHYTLATNYRSHPNLISAVNSLFERSEHGFEHKQIPFVPVAAGKSANKNIVSAGITQPVMELFHLNGTIEGEEAQPGFKAQDGERLIAKWCVADIKDVLFGSKRHELQNEQDSKPIKPGDISVLVRNRNQAKLIKDLLAEQGLSSVYLSRDSVFASEMATDLFLLLRAIQTPNNEHYVRAALTTGLFAYDIDESLKLQQEPELWQRHLLWFFQANELWSRGKVAAAIAEILLNAETYTKWYQSYPEQVNRMVTDLRHLVELLQHQSTKLSGLEKLFLWYEKQISELGYWQEPGQEQQMRLESDSELIQISTLHASKGLEYPVVYLPFMAEFKPAKKAMYTSQANNQAQTYRVDNRLLELQIAEHERLAEDIRLLYVAMTRPVYRLVVGLFNLTDAYKRPVLPQTAIGRLLLSEDTQKPADADIEVACKNLQNANMPYVTYETHNAQEVASRFNNAKSTLVTSSDQIEQGVGQKISARSFSGKVDRSWRMLSYSALAGASHSSHSSLGVKSDDEQDTSIDEISGVTDESNYAVNVTPENLVTIPSQFTFPKGATAGTCLHWFFETMDFQKPVSEQLNVLVEGLDKYGFETSWQSVLVPWLQACLDKQIDGFCLSQLTADNISVEMEFYFDFSHLSARILNNALLMMGVESLVATSTELIQDTESGVLKGFIDLTLCHEGKFYVLDYKSNYLGDSYHDYDNLNLEQAMTDHNYHLQALIYVLALHRFLEHKIPDYDYDKHVGGAVYLFLRGINIEDTSENTGVYFHNISKEAVTYLDNALRKSRKERDEKDWVGDRVIKSEAKNVSNTQQMGFDFE